MSVSSALLVAVVVALLALAVGVAFGFWLAPRMAERRQRRATEQSGMTLSEMFAYIVSLSTLGIVVVDTYRDVVYTNDRAGELGLVRDRLLDDQAWAAAQRTLATGEDAEFDLSPVKRATPGSGGLAVRGQVRQLTEEDGRFAVVYVDDQSEQARMEASRRDFVANVSHELKTPVGAMGLLAEALLASTDDTATVTRFAEKIVTESNRLANMVTELIELSRLQGAEPLPDLDGVDVDSIVAEAVSRHKVAADNADIAITTDAPHGLSGAGQESPAGHCAGQPGVQRNRVLAQGISGVDQPASTRRQHRDRGDRSRHRHRAGRPGAGFRTILPRRQGAVPGHRRHRVSGWPSSNTLRPTTTEPSGCGVSRAPDRRSRCRFRPVPIPTRNRNSTAVQSQGGRQNQ